MILACNSIAFAHEHGLEYQWTCPDRRQETLFQTYVMLGAVAAFAVFKGIMAIVRRRMTA